MTIAIRPLPAQSLAHQTIPTPSRAKLGPASRFVSERRASRGPDRKPGPLLYNLRPYVIITNPSANPEDVVLFSTGHFSPWPTPWGPSYAGWQCPNHPSTGHCAPARSNPSSWEVASCTMPVPFAFRYPTWQSSASSFRRCSSASAAPLGATLTFSSPKTCPRLALTPNPLCLNPSNTTIWSAPRDHRSSHPTSL